MIRGRWNSTLFPYTTLFRSRRHRERAARHQGEGARPARVRHAGRAGARAHPRSEEHTSELQSHVNLVCRLLLEKKKSLDPYTFMAFQACLYSMALSPLSGNS